MIQLTSLQMGEIKQFNWTAYFEENNRHRLQIDFTQEPELSPKDKKLIFPSIQIFQRGEASEGQFILNCAKHYANQNHSSEYLEAMKWFVLEENSHSAYLKSYMDHYQVPVRTRSVLDGIFRVLRKTGGLKSEVIVLVTAEMIALSYYRALARCVDSPALKSICRQMLHDELRHIVFQSYTLYKLKTNSFEKLLRILLMEVTMSIVWLSMKDVFQVGGYTFKQLATDCLGYLKQSIRIAERGVL